MYIFEDSLVTEEIKCTVQRRLTLFEKLVRGLALEFACREASASAAVAL